MLSWSSCAQVSRAATSQVMGDCPVSVAKRLAKVRAHRLQTLVDPLVPGGVTSGRLGDSGASDADTLIG